MVYQEGLGLPSRESSVKNSKWYCCLFQDASIFLTALWPRASLDADSGLPLRTPSPECICLALNVASRTEVGLVMVDATAACGTIVKPAKYTFLGGEQATFKLSICIFRR